MIEMFYVADTGNNRILLFTFTPDDPSVTWNNMVARVAAGDIFGAMQYFSALSVDKYR